MQPKYNKSTYLTSLIITILIYLVLFAVFSITYLNSNNRKEASEISIEFREVASKKKKQQQLVIYNPRIYKIPKEKIVLPKVREEVFEVESKITKVEIDSILTRSDSIVLEKSWLDSIVVAEPNINVLKYAISKHIKENPIEKTDSAKLVDELRYLMQDYYNKKYPTPVHNFGDGAPGIPIGDIINIFSSDTTDVERIKKYLKIGKYDKK